MNFFDFMTSLPPLRFIFVCLLLLGVAASVIYAIFKAIKELSLKFGDVAISLKSSEQKKDIVGLVFDFGTFQDQINDTRDLAVETLHKQAKRYTKLQLVQYLQRLRGEYAKVLEPTGSESKQITNVIFNMFTNELKSTMFGYLMDIYEKNHLAQKTEKELKEMAHDHYCKLADMFKDHAAAIWIPMMAPYSQVRDVSVGIAEFVEGLTYDVLSYYKMLSETRAEVKEVSKRIIDDVKAGVDKNLNLPPNAIYLAENFYTEAGGLDAELVGEFLKEK